MVPGILKIVVKSVRFYIKPVRYQIFIVALLAAVISGTLLSGWSVRASLRKSAVEHLGNTGLLITSGTRFFDLSLADKLKNSAGINCTGLLEINGFCQNLNTQKGVSNTHIYGVSNDFFRFHGSDTININPGEAVINEKLAATLDLKQGDELIIRFKENSDIPSDAPFAPAKTEGTSIVRKVGTILKAAGSGNFSLSINQVVPENIFLNLSDLNNDPDKKLKINRLLIGNKNKMTRGAALEILRESMTPSDLGLSIIPLKKKGAYELRSSRIFLEHPLISEIENSIPSSAPVITYLANRLSHGTRSTPYSFVSALPPSLYPQMEAGNNMIINRWLAEDLAIDQGDTLAMAWYAPDSLNRLIEKSSRFCIRKVVEMEDIWADSLLMPDFPGISGSKSCTDWDAGVTIKLSDIRHKDEEYWDKFRGTPKAFISYDTGIELWGNNFGQATAIRFPEAVSGKEILSKLSGNLDPEKNGFRIIDLYGDSMKAASESVDFSTLLLSLGFFLILASVVLLSFTITTYLESKNIQIRTYFALGFRSRWIKQLLLLESAMIAVIGCIIGSFTGLLVNVLIIRLLNTVWNGAVQTDTLSAFFSLEPILTGFFVTLIIAMIFLEIKIRHYLNNLNREKKLIHSLPSRSLNLIFLLGSLFISIALYSLSLIIKEQELSLGFASGALLLVFMIFSWRHYFIGQVNLSPNDHNTSGKLSRLYYSYYPSQAVTPILFISAGIFAVFLTGANRMSFDSSQLKASGGTGGFLLWCDNSIPVKADLTSSSGKASLGLDENQLAAMQFVEIKKYVGDDASCLNLNHISVPSLLGTDPAAFISRGSFSFATAIERKNVNNPWMFLSLPPSENTVYGIADQTVLQWGLKIKPGDTLMMRSESGQKLNIIIAAGLKSSVFQGYVIIGMDNFRKYFPSVSGSSIFLVDGNTDLTDLYSSALNDRLGNYGIKVQKTNDRLASFYEVTNTYLSVFGVFGALGMVTGIAGLGFILLRNYNYRKREFALMLATGFKITRIRNLIFREQLLILVAGMTSGAIPAFIATLPSLKNNSDIPWVYLLSIMILIFCSGFTALVISLKSVTGSSLTASLKKE